MTQYTGIGQKVCEGQEGNVFYQVWCNKHHVYTVIAKNTKTQQQFRDTYQGVVSWWFGEDEVDTKIINQKLDMVIKKARDEANS